MRKVITVSLVALMMATTAGCECWDCFMRFENWKNQTLFGCCSNNNACDPCQPTFGAPLMAPSAAGVTYGAPAASFAPATTFGGDCGGIVSDCGGGIVVQSPLMSDCGAGGCGTAGCGAVGGAISGCGPAGCGTVGAPGVIMTPAPAPVIAPGQVVTPGTTVVPGPETYAPAIR